MEVRLHYASAEKTPEKLAVVMSELKSEEGDNKVYIVGGRMNNGLTSIIRSYTNPNDLVIGIPVDDDKTNGLSSFISTSEKSFGSPILMAGLNNSYAALNIGYKILQRAEELKSGNMMNNQIVIYEDKNNSCSITRQLPQLRSELEQVGLDYVSKFIDEIGPNDIVVNIFNIKDKLTTRLSRVDEILRNGLGIQIGILESQPYQKEQDYVQCLKGTKKTGIVSIGAYANAVHIAAQIAQNENSLGLIEQRKDEIVRNIEENKGLSVVNGIVIKF